VFLLGFSGIVGFRRGVLWTKCGELCGEGGFRNALKTVMDFTHRFQVYFGAKTTRLRWDGSRLR
jgi:hypothetical protein